MRNDPSAAAPYRVHLSVLAFSGSFWNPAFTTERWADVALTPAQAAVLTGGADRKKILSALAFPAAAVIRWWAVATVALLLVGFIPGVPAAAPAALWTVGTGAVALILGRRWRFLGRTRRAIDRVLTFASVGDAVYRVGLHDEHWSQLYRIDTALTVLQANAGTTYDDRARAAVRHVLFPLPVRHEPDTAPKGTSPKAKYRAAMHEALNGLLRPPAPTPVDPVSALEAEAARFRVR